jgi:hypothetical protein
MKRANYLSFVLVVALGCGLGMVMAQDNPAGAAAPSGTAPAPTESTISGTLVSSSTNSIVIKTDTGVESTYVVDGTTALPAEMKPGDRINVEYRLLDGGAYHAARVTLGTETVAPSEASAASAVGSDSGGSASGGSSSGLPQTASPLPLYGVIAVLAIGAALGLRAILKQPRTRT